MMMTVNRSLGEALRSATPFLHGLSGRCILNEGAVGL